MSLESFKTLSIQPDTAGLPVSLLELCKQLLVSLSELIHDAAALFECTFSRKL